MADQKDDNSFADHVWHTYLSTGTPPPAAGAPWFERRGYRKLARRMPSEPRCRLCYYPFEGVGGKLVRSLLGIEPSKMNPHMCNICERFAERFAGGTEIEMTLLFADVRGSTAIAETMSPTEFSQLIGRFYQAATRVLFRSNAMVEKLIGDAVNGFYVPGFAGQDHASVAVNAGRSILKSVGYGQPGGPWIPVGVGVHTGVAYVGSVTSDGGGVDIVVLGDAANTAARLSSKAGAGELVLSESTRAAAGLPVEELEPRELLLKGKATGLDAWVISG